MFQKFNVWKLFTSFEFNLCRQSKSGKWYLTPIYSVGFSDVDEIEQDTCDISLLDDDKKLCWHLDYLFGEWRLGSINDIFNTNYNKKIFVRP